jgi:uncharacterized phiE125 gp8 family phage protein
MKHVVTTAPATEPVTLAEMRAHLGTAQDSETTRDTIISGRIKSAREWAENFTRRPFIAQTITGYDSDWPYTDRDGYKISLKSPFSAVTSIKYYDTDGVQQTLASDQYQLDTVEGCIVPAYDVTWPSARVQPNSIQVVYTAGYGNAASVPESIKEAIRFVVGQWEQWQPSIEGGTRPMTVPYAAEQLLRNYVDMREYL